MQYKAADYNDEINIKGKNLTNDLEMEDLNRENILRAIENDELEALTTMLKNPSVASLNFEGDGIGNEGVKVLAEALQSNSTITNLDLYDSNISDEGAVALAKVLQSNSTITNLELGSNKIGTEGAKAIAEALKSNSALTKLGIEYNEICAEGAAALADALQSNSTITNIELGSNNIGIKGANVLAVSLKTNYIITHFSMDFNGVEGSIKDSSLDSIDHGKALIAKLTSFLQYPSIDSLDQDKSLITKLTNLLECLVEKSIEASIDRNKSLVTKLANFLVDEFTNEANTFNTLGDPKKMQDYHAKLKFYQAVNKELLRASVQSAYELKGNKNHSFATLSHNVDSYINDNYFELRSVHKNSCNKEVAISALPKFISHHIFSFLGSRSLWEGVVLEDEQISGTHEASENPYDVQTNPEQPVLGESAEITL